MKNKVSQFGRYTGYSVAIYDGYTRCSRYLALRDGTRLAYDLLLPTKAGVPADEPLPTLFKYTPYLRAFTIYDQDGKFLLGDLFPLTYTTPALETALEVTGHPVVRLWLATDAPDLDVFVYLEDVDSKGNSTYITEGNLRASHRTLSAAPYDNLGLPFHRHYESDLRSIQAGSPVELVLDLLPTSYLSQAGHRIRITLTFADDGNFDTPRLDPAPTLTLLRSPEYSSYVELPVFKNPFLGRDHTG